MEHFEGMVIGRMPRSDVAALLGGFKISVIPDFTLRSRAEYTSFPNPACSLQTPTIAIRMQDNNMGQEAEGRFGMLGPSSM